MGKTSCCDADGLKRGAWTPDEDQKLLAYIQRHGLGRWSSLPPKAGLQRCGKSCRLRWNNYLRPDIKRGEFSLQEDRTIIQLHALLGNKWSAIAAHLPKRTDNEVKRYWNTCLKKRLAMMGIDPVTHKPISTILRPANGDPKKASNLSHMAQWESARLEAEARESQLRQQELPGSTSLSAVASGTLLEETTIAPSPDLLKAWQSLLLKPIEGRVGGGDVCGVLGARSGANYSNGGFITDHRSMALDQVEDHGQATETISNIGDGNFFEEIADILLSTNLDNHSLYTDGLITSTGNGGNGELAGMIINNGWNDIVSLLNYGLPNNASVV